MLTPRPTSAELLARVLGSDYAERFDSVDLAQLAHTIAVSRKS